MTQQDTKTLTEIIQNTQTVLSEQLTDFKTANATKFAQIDARFEQMEFRMARFETSLNQLAEQQTEFGSKLDRVLTGLDGLVKLVTDDDAERVALSAQVTRHEDWLVKNAPTLGVTYTPGA